ncbi:MAG: riboflavin kinase [Alistipes sp.]|nr:riboflavin kinase [Alistipes sp.]
MKVAGRNYNAMANIGTRPSVDGQTRLLEIHIFNYRGSLYGRYVKINLLKKIRDEQRFSSIEALKEQLLHDAEECNK